MDKLLQLLEHDALLTPEKLGRMLRMKPAEVKRKIENYKKQGVILGYKAIINAHHDSTDHVKAVIEIRVLPERESGFDRTAERISKFEEVTSCFLMSGGYDLLIFVEGKTLNEVASFVARKLASLERVQSTATRFMLKAYKDYGTLMTQPNHEERVTVSP